MVVRRFLTEGRESRMVQRLGASTARYRRRALVELQAHHAGDPLHEDVHERVDGLSFRRPPPALVYQIRVTRRNLILERQGPAVERELLQLLECGIQKGSPGGLIHTTRLHPDQPVLHEIDPAYPMPGADLVQGQEEIDRVQSLIVDRHGPTLLEADLQVFGFVRRGLGSRGPLVHRLFGLERGILERAALMRDVPNVLVARVELGFVNTHQRYLASPSVLQRVLTGLQVPLTPGSDHSQIWCERGEGQFEPNLIVPLSGAPMRKRICSDLERYLHHPTRDDGTGHGGTQKVLTTVDGP